MMKKNGVRSLLLWLLLLPVCVNGFSQSPFIQNRPGIVSKRSSLKNVRPETTQTARKVSSGLSPAAEWHRDRRRQMMAKYKDQIAPLEQSNSLFVGLPLLLLGNGTLLVLSWASQFLSVPAVFLLAVFPGSMFSLWQLQILHDCLHGSLLPKSLKGFQDKLLFWGSMPSAFGYFLYLRYGHLTHHKSFGDAKQNTLEQLFNSSQTNFEDGDILFVAHRMKLKGPIGPKFNIFGKTIELSISHSAFEQWKTGNAVWNACVFASSFLFERILLVINDMVVAVTGRNFFFPNKPADFHQECAAYCRCALLIRGLLWALAGWKSLLFLYLSETLWSIPPHPSSAMFVTNHGSKVQQDSGACQPSSSTYAGRWFSVFTLGTNYHVEHHDFPTIPFHKLGELRKIAPEFYPPLSQPPDNLWTILHRAFADPDFYACMDAGVGTFQPSIDSKTS